MKLNGLQVLLNISVWTGRKKSSAAEEVVSSHFSSSKKAGSFYKKLILSPHLDKIKSIAASARKHHLHMTQPWDDNGHRYLSPMMVIPYSDKMSELTDSFEDAVQVFLDSYENEVYRAKGMLGNLYAKEDYPSVEMMKDLFSLKFNISNIPEKIENDLLEDTVSSNLQDRLDEENRKKFNGVKKHIWETLCDKLLHLADKLSDSKAIFKDSSVKNIIEYADTISTMSDVLDNELTVFVTDIKAVLDLDIDRLRKDATYRQAYSIHIDSYCAIAKNNADSY